MNPRLARINWIASPEVDRRLDLIIHELASERNDPDFPTKVGISVGVVDREARTAVTGAFAGDKPMYPASVVKLFYLAYANDLLRAKRIEPTEEFLRALRDMIVDSNNDATGLVVDAVTRTTGGPELPPTSLAKWMARRQVVNRYFAQLGYQGVFACQKTWNEGPYGREKQGYGSSLALRNSLTPNACRRLIVEICLDAIVGAEECFSMKSLLRRELSPDWPNEDPQASEFIGRYLPAGSQLWSKAGWVTNERHDVAFIKLPDGREFGLAIFTHNMSEEKQLIGELARRVLRSLADL